LEFGVVVFLMMQIRTVHHPPQIEVYAASDILPLRKRNRLNYVNA